MWKTFFKFQLIITASGLVSLAPNATCEPVCYTRISLDEYNTKNEMVDCDCVDKICKRFSSREKVNWFDVVDSPCDYPEDHSLPFGGSSQEIDFQQVSCQKDDLPIVTAGCFNCSDYSLGDKCTLTCDDEVSCQNVDLPMVTTGFFNCSGYSLGDKCNLTCDDGYYPSSSKETVCEENGDFQSTWSVGTFRCSEVSCQKGDLPIVTAGSFNCSGYSFGNKCNLTYDRGYYPSLSKETVCEGNEISCREVDLPIVTAGFFNCSGYSLRDKCNLTCEDGYYPSSSEETVCEVNDDFHGTWSVGTFQCSDCNNWNGSDYKYIRAKKSRSASQQLCVQDNADIVTIESEEEDGFVHKMTGHCSNFAGRFWIGLEKRGGKWEWSDSTIGAYRNWGEGQPDGQDCAVIRTSDGKWEDRMCSNHFFVVCERKKSSK